MGGSGVIQANGPQRDNRQPTQGPKGALGFLDLGKILVKPSPGREWGEICTPKGFLGTMETIPLAKKPRKPRGDQYLHAVMFQATLVGFQALVLGLGAPKMGSGVKKSKAAHRTTMQNPLVYTPNVAIRCKLWPKVGGNASADKTSVVSTDKTSVVSADKTSVVSADISQDIPQAV